MRDITLCHPRLQTLAAELIKECEKQGLQIKIGETLRTTAEQDALYAQGRTKPGTIVTNAKGSSYSSYHQWGVAFDIYRATAAVPIMIKMDSFPKSARSVHRSDWNGAEPGRASWTSHTSSCQTGDHRRAG